MREGSVHEEITGALAASGLREATAAILLLQSEGRVDVHQPVVSCADLLMTYEVRLRHVRAIRSEHAHRLSEAISEFVSNHQGCGLQAGRWITIRGGEESHFLIFRLAAGRLLGCLPVVSKLDVSTERWTELWAREQ